MGSTVPPERRSLALSPLNQRRWQNFKANRRGYWSFWIFLVLFVVSLFAEFIANDKPFLVSYKGEILFPGARRPIRKTKFGGVSRPRPTIAIPYLQKRDRRQRLDRSGRRSATPTTRTISICRRRRRRTPTWMLTEAQCKPVAETQGRHGLPRPRMQLARHRRPGPRRGGAADLRLPHLGAVRPDPDRSSRRSSASRPARCRAISAAGPICCSSASSRSGPRSRRSICC